MKHENIKYFIKNKTIAIVFEYFSVQLVLIRVTGADNIDSMLTVLLVPVVKDKTGKISRIENYRLIALSSMLQTCICA